MAVKWISAGWKTQQKTSAYKYERVYIDFRQSIYPPANSTLAYTLVASGDNQPGSHNLTSGYCDYLLDLPSTLTIFARIKPNFEYDTVDYPTLWSWYIDATHVLRLGFDGTSHKYYVYWQDGGTARGLESAAYANTGELQVWTNIVCTLDLTTGTTAGSALYINQSSVDTAWGGNIDVKSSNFPLFSLRHENGIAGDYIINQIRVYPNKIATSAQVTNIFKDLEEEEIVWHLNGEGCGRTRCNITRHIRGMTLERKVEEPSNGAQGANRLTAELHSHQGEYADDQYAAFDPTAEQFNGTNTLAQRYLQKQARVEAETWYGTSWELFFLGRLDSDLFRRRSVVDGISIVQISADDGVGDIAREMKRRSRGFTGKTLSDTTEADSLIHLIARLATAKDVYNYLANSSFENADITLSWDVSGAGAALSAENGGLFGSKEAQLDYDAATCTAFQTVTFTGTKKLNKGESYNFSIFCKCADAVSNAASLIKLAEYDSGGSNDDTDEPIVLTGGEGWVRFEVTHKITDADSDRLVAVISLGDDTVLSMDGAMLIQGDRAVSWWALNNNNGVAAVESADDADYDSYDTVGFDVDAVNVTHPYVFIPATTSVWDYLKELGDACGPMYLGMDGCGTLKLRCKLATGYADPSSLETITSVQSVDSVLEIARANKIIGHGVKIDIGTAIKTMWLMDAIPMFIIGGGRPIVIVANGDSFPEPATYGEFWAKYGDVD